MAAIHRAKPWEKPRARRACVRAARLSNGGVSPRTKGMTAGNPERGEGRQGRGVSETETSTGEQSRDERFTRGREMRLEKGGGSERTQGKRRTVNGVVVALLPDRKNQ